MADTIETFEAETQLLGSSPVAFVDAVINAVNDYAYDASEQMLKTLLASDPQLDPVAMRRVVNKLLNFVQDQIDKYYDKYELFCLTNVLKIPSHVGLPTDLPPSADLHQLQEKERELRDKQNTLRQSIREAISLRQSQILELQSLRAKEDAIKVLKTWKSEVAAACKATGVHKPREYVTMVTTDLERTTQECEKIATNARAILKHASAADSGETAYKRRRTRTQTTSVKDLLNAV
eukprot:m.69730 g.69730  ORF g.69730 m.69730 type:complete len:235 (-) comp16045_c0_seq4:1217-1921(-)